MNNFQPLSSYHTILCWLPGHRTHEHQSACRLTRPAGRWPDSMGRRWPLPSSTTGKPLGGDTPFMMMIMVCYCCFGCNIQLQLSVMLTVYSVKLMFEHKLITWNDCVADSHQMLFRFRVICRMREVRWRSHPPHPYSMFKTRQAARTQYRNDALNIDLSERSHHRALMSGLHIPLFGGKWLGGGSRWARWLARWAITNHTIAQPWIRVSLAEVNHLLRDQWLTSVSLT